MNKEVSNIEKELQDLEAKKQQAENRLSEIIKTTIEKIAKQHNSSKYQTVSASNLINRPWSPQFFDWNASGEAIMQFLEKLPVGKWKMSLIDKLVSKKDNEDWVFFDNSYSVNGYRYTNKIPVSTEFINAIIEAL